MGLQIRFGPITMAIFEAVILLRSECEATKAKNLMRNLKIADKALHTRLITATLQS